MSDETRNNEEGSDFDLSSFSFLDDVNLFGDKDEEIDEVEVAHKLVPAIQTILGRIFQHPVRRLVEFADDRLNFACPYCGDSSRDIYKKRGNIFFVSMNFHCFNCGHHCDALTFLHDFQVDCDLRIAGKVSNIIQSSRAKSKFRSREMLRADLVFGMDLMKYAIPRQQIMDFFRCREVKGSEIEGYLDGRLQFEHFRFGYNARRDALFVFNVDPETLGVLGFQIRDMKDNGPNKYKTYINSKIREIMCLEEVPDDLRAGVNALSKTFRISEVNFGLPVTVFEGPLDSFLYRNSIALCSVKSSLPFEIDSFQFMFDMDTSGTEKTIQMLNRGYPVFLWEKFLADAKIDRKQFRKLDLNDLLKYAKAHGINLPAFDDYFSKDKLDALWI
jgi:hypothetical protein